MVSPLTHEIRGIISRGKAPEKDKLTSEHLKFARAKHAYIFIVYIYVSSWLYAF